MRAFTTPAAPGGFRQPTEPLLPLPTSGARGGGRRSTRYAVRHGGRTSGSGPAAPTPESVRRRRCRVEAPIGHGPDRWRRGQGRGRHRTSAPAVRGFPAAIQNGPMVLAGRLAKWGEVADLAARETDSFTRRTRGVRGDALRRGYPAQPPGPGPHRRRRRDDGRSPARRLRIVRQGR
jgi:hypothetical protein